MSTVVLDTITGKSTATTITIGSTPVVSASANSMTIRGEGSAQTSIQQGLAKAWCKTSGVGTPAIADSNNMASVTDHGTGLETFQFTAAMGNALFSTTAQGHLSGTVITIQQLTDSGQTPTTARTCASVHSVGASGTDCNKNVTVHGDLA